MFRRRRSYRTKFFILLFMAGIVFSIWALDRAIRSTVYEMAEVKAVQTATVVINNAVRLKVAEGDTRYQDLVEIHKDSTGKIVLIQANTIRLNKMAADTTLAVQSALTRLQEGELAIPLGQITGIYYLANFGPRIRVHIVPIGTVRVEVSDRFEQAGINQTRHYIYLCYDTDIRIVIPLKSGRASVATQVPVAENIIVGEVPTTYVSLSEGLFGAGINK
ncbi:MAG: sporulation protein YunB [Peptococcaceae bacterium]|nr:sporulation protein YunB [Peptococcaceae bacterium]